MPIDRHVVGRIGEHHVGPLGPQQAGIAFGLPGVAAKKAISEARGLVGAFAMPEPSAFAFVEFPGDFTTPSGVALTSMHELPTGRYRQL